MTIEEFKTKPIGLVLTGGGGKGGFQIGAFRAICEAGLDSYIKAVSGTSVGALNLALWCHDKGGSDSVNLWSMIRPRDVLDIDTDLLLDGYEGISDHEHLRGLIRKINLNCISSSDMDLYATVTQYPTMTSPDSYGVVKYLRLNGRTTDDIETILLASSSMPGVYAPVSMDGFFYKDGGIKDNLPVTPLYDIGIRHFIVINLHYGSTPDFSAFPGGHFLVISPSKDLGDLLTGTLDFTGEGAKWRMDLGYMDAARTIRYFGANDVPIDDIASIELRQLENTWRVNHSMDNANHNLSKIDDILKKYDI